MLLFFHIEPNITYNPKNLFQTSPMSNLVVYENIVAYREAYRESGI